MWRWVHINSRRRHARHISQGYSHEEYNQLGSITQTIVDAVVHYNEALPLAENFTSKDVDERVIEAAEEESAKVFLDGLLDLVQKENTKDETPS